MFTIISKEQDVSGKWIVQTQIDSYSNQSFSFSNDPSTEIMTLAVEAYILVRQIEVLQGDLVSKNQELEDAITNQ